MFAHELDEALVHELEVLVLLMFDMHSVPARDDTTCANMRTCGSTKAGASIYGCISASILGCSPALMTAGPCREEASTPAVTTTRASPGAPLAACPATVESLSHRVLCTPVPATREQALTRVRPKLNPTTVRKALPVAG